MKISVIIPAYNEENTIAYTVHTVRRLADPNTLEEITVVDGESTDRTVKKANEAGANVIRSDKGRAIQMNNGACRASGDILYFLHADSIPPAGFDQNILKAVSEGYSAGCFQLAFDDNHFLLKLYAWFTQFDIDAFRFGDQSLFILKEIFAKIEGFKEDHVVMEDNEIVRRIKQESPFHVIPRQVKTSARKYREVGVLKLQLIFSTIYLGYQLGISQSALFTWYNRWIRNSFFPEY